MKRFYASPVGLLNRPDTWERIQRALWDDQHREYPTVSLPAWATYTDDAPRAVSRIERK